MFICAICKRSTNPRVPMTFVVIKTRRTSYPFRKNANVRRVGGKLEKRHDKGGQGQETVVEVALCPKCVKEIGE